MDLRQLDYFVHIAELGGFTKPGTPEQFGQYLQAQYDKWNALIKQAGISADN